MYNKISIDLDLIKSFGFDVYIPVKDGDPLCPLTHAYYSDALGNIGYVQCAPVWDRYSIATVNKIGRTQAVGECYKSELSREFLKKGFLTNPLKIHGEIIVKHSNVQEFLDAQKIIKLQKY